MMGKALQNGDKCRSLHRSLCKVSHIYFRFWTEFKWLDIFPIKFPRIKSHENPFRGLASSRACTRMDFRVVLIGGSLGYRPA